MAIQQLYVPLLKVVLPLKADLQSILRLFKMFRKSSLKTKLFRVLIEYQKDNRRADFFIFVALAIIWVGFKLSL